MTDDESRTTDWLARDEAARSYVVESTRAVESLVASTYGPRGSDSVVLTFDGKGEPETVVTKDAGEILDAIERGDGFVHPVAALFVDGLDSVRRGLHDGTTAAALLGARLVESGVDLIEEGLHPGSIHVGYAMAANRAGEVLDGLARPVDPTDRTLLSQVASSTLTTDLDATRRHEYADAVSAAVAGLAAESDGEWFDTDDVTVRTTVGDGCELYRGQVVKRRPGAHETSERSRLSFDWSPSVEGVRTGATVAVVEREIDVEETATSFGSDGSGGVTLETAGGLSAYASARDAAVESVAAGIADLGVEVLVVREELDDSVARAIRARGVSVVDRVQYPKSDIHRVARATGASVVGHVADLDRSKLGRAGQVYERRVGDEKWTYFDECDGSVFTLVVGTPTEQSRRINATLVENAVETTAVAALDRQLLPGAGAAPLAVAHDLRSFARSVEGREQLAIEAFADVCESLAVTLAANAGYDPLRVQATLRNAHASAASPAPIGFDVDTGKPVDAWDHGVVEPRRVFSQAVDSAVATAEQLLSIDAVVTPGVDLGRLDPQTEHA
ncbi:chaperonin subunit alpha [Salinigranum rubrum]|uniref:Chaperonin subunit alpha n=1 Tax=Salinigranum rubrum TaxID=755307 RepID=A0A2I8VH33_9EURY|nr:TCP-1/cpn60 chaperonin family protein [Salinigranum rubrum]AUV80359.1 chaperonin subunit alpha [Salinigranum rubrum]